MSLAICVLITWLVIIMLSLIPKKFTETEMVFIYFVNTIFELSIFTILHVNLKWIEVSHSIEKSFADLVFRIIMLPLIFVITANILMYHWKLLKWLIVIGFILSSLFLQFMLNKLGIVIAHHWNPIYSLLLFSSYTLFSSLVAWFISHVDGKEVSEN